MTVEKVYRVETQEGYDCSDLNDFQKGAPRELRSLRSIIDGGLSDGV